MPLESLLSNPNPEVPRSRSILSRLSSPLSKHARNTFDFAIELADEFKKYSPGETVKGHIVLTVSKGFDITHLVVALQGYARVYRHQNNGEAPPPPEILLDSRGTSGPEYHGNGLVSLFQDEKTLCGSGFLKKQIYRFAFELRFPSKGLPSAIDVSYCSSNYHSYADCSSSSEVPFPT